MIDILKRNTLITTQLFLATTQNLRNERWFKLITSTQLKKLIKKKFNSTRMITSSKNFK